MADNFDAKTEATNIQRLAFSCLDDNSSGKTITAALTEGVLAKELASVWGAPDKLIAVAAELQNSAPTSGFRKSSVDTGNQPTDVTGLDFRNLNLIEPDFAMNVRNTGGNLEVTVGGAHDRSDVFKIDHVVDTVSVPVRHEK